jgi:hypothetical protein
MFQEIQDFVAERFIAATCLVDVCLPSGRRGDLDGVDKDALRLVLLRIHRGTSCQFGPAIEQCEEVRTAPPPRPDFFTR